MARSKHSTQNWLQGIFGARTQKAVKALISHETTGYETSAASGTSTGLNGSNRVRNSATLFAEPNLIVGVVGGTQYRVHGKLYLALTAAQGIKFDFAAGNATIVTSSMGGNAKFWTRGSNNSGTAAGATNAIPFTVALTALNTAVDGGTNNTWIECEFEFVATFATSGSVQLEFGQSSAGASNTDILAGSYIRAVPLDHVTQ